MWFQSESVRVKDPPSGETTDHLFKVGSQCLGSDSDRQSEPAPERSNIAVSNSGNEVHVKLGTSSSVALTVERSYLSACSSVAAQCLGSDSGRQSEPAPQRANIAVSNSGNEVQVKLGTSSSVALTVERSYLSDCSSVGALSLTYRTLVHAHGEFHRPFTVPSFDALAEASGPGKRSESTSQVEVLRKTE